MSGSVEINLGLNIRDFNRNLERASDRLKETGSQLQSIGGNMSRYVTAPLIGAGAAAVSFSATFDESAAKVRSTANLTADQTEKLKKGVVETAKETGESFDSIFDSMQKAVSGSLDLVQSQALVEQASKATAAGFGDMERLVDVSTTAFDLFTDHADSAEEILDQIANAARNTQVNVEDLAPAFSRGASTAANLNISQNDLLASLSVVAERMGDTQRAGRANAQMLMQLQKPTSEAATLIEDMFGSVDNLHNSMSKDFIGTLSTLRKRLQESGHGLEEVFSSSQSLDAAQVLLSDSGERATQVLEKQAEAAGTINQAFEDSDNPMRQFRIMWLQLQDAMRPIGDIILKTVIPAFQSVAGFIESLADRFRSLTDGNQRLVVAIAGVAAAIGPALLAIGSIIKVLGFALGAINPVTLAIAGIGAAISVMVAAVRTNIGRFRDIWDKVSGAVGESIKKITDSISRLSVDTDGSVGVMKAIWQGFADSITFIVDVVGTAVEWLADTLSTAVDVIVSIVEWMRAAWNRDLKGMDEAARRIFGGISNFMVNTLQKALDIVMAAIGRVAKVFSNEWYNAINGARQDLNNFAEGLKFNKKETDNTGKAILELARNFNILDRSAKSAGDQIANSSRAATKVQGKQTQKRIELIERETEAKQIADEIDTDLSEKTKQRQQALTEHGIQMSNDKADAEEQSQERIEKSLESAAQASFRSADAEEDAASAVKSAAIDSIKSQISKGIASVVSSTLAQYAPALGPAAIPIAAAAGAAASSLLNSAIPKLAGGGVLAGETMFIGGEYPGASTNPEIVAPLDRLRGMLGEGNSQNNMPKEVRLIMDGDDAVGLMHRNSRTRKRKGL